MKTIDQFAGLVNELVAAESELTTRQINFCSVGAAIHRAKKAEVALTDAEALARAEAAETDAVQWRKLAEIQEFNTRTTFNVSNITQMEGDDASEHKPTAE